MTAQRDRDIRSGLAPAAGIRLLLAALSLAAGCATDGTPAAACTVPSVDCGSTPTPAFDAEGGLWVAFAFEGRVYVARAEDPLGDFAVPVRVNEVAEELDVNGENRPKIAFGNGGEVFVSWTRKLPGGFNGEIRFSRAAAGAQRFEAPRTINDDGLVTGHRFETLHVDSDGHVYMVWIDKRDLVAAEAGGRDYVGAAVYYTVSTDGGATFATNRKVADSSCECCRIAVARAPNDDVALFYRAIFDEHIRDHAFAMINERGVALSSVRATWDGWRLDACPHHGPAILPAADSGFHLTWFTGGAQNQGVYYGRLNPVDGSLSDIRSVAGTPAAGHPSLAAGSDGIALAWKEFDGQSTNVRVIRSVDDGTSWSLPETLASTVGGSDHPLLLSHAGDIFLSWHTGDEGLRVIPVAFANGD